MKIDLFNLLKKGYQIKTRKKRIEKKEEVKIEVEGLKLPSFTFGEIPLRVERPIKRKRYVYPLIPRTPSKNEPIFAYARIEWNDEKKRYEYKVVEPPLTEKLKNIMKRIKELLEQRLDIDFSKLRKAEAMEYISKEIDAIIEYFKFVISPTEKLILKYYIQRDFVGLGKIEPLMQDPNIEDISCDGVGIPIFVFHRNPEIGSVVTNVVFEDAEELDSFIVKLAQLCGKSVSVAEPLVDGTLPDGSRLQATLATDIARRGSNFTIRKFTEKPLTPIHLLKYNTISIEALAYLWLCVDYGRSILISGGTATGKTTLLNVLSLFIRPERKIVSIEDTAELRLPHPHWVPAVARSPIAEEGRGAVDMFDLLKESLRQRPDYIVVGEVRGREAYILFQQISTGHPSLATIHAENIYRLMDRLTTPPISLPPSLVSSLDIIIFLQRVRIKERSARRVKEVLEITGYDPNKKLPTYNVVFKWNPVLDKIEIAGKSYVFRKICETTGMAEKELIDEFKRRCFVLKWMEEKNVLDYKDVYKVVTTYYASPNKVLALIRKGL